jgi:hypothetical protein
MDNQPLPKATVRFQPVDRKDGRLFPDCYGETDEQGNYTLKPAVGQGTLAGAVPGKYLVQISIFDREGKGKSGPREMIAAKYNQDSQLSFTVPAEGTKEADFQLKSR